MMVARNRQSLGDNIFEIPFTHQNIADAAYRKKMMGTISNSVLKGEGTFSGFVAEEAAKDFLNAELVNQYGNDRFKFDLLWNNYKVEVKAISLAFAPRETFHVRIHETSFHQNPDLFVFLCVQYPNKEYKPDELVAVWMLGAIKRDKFYQKAEFARKDKPSSFSPVLQKESAFILKINQLSNISNYAINELNFTKQYSFNDLLK